jgi:hypothetical protein
MSKSILCAVFALLTAAGLAAPAVGRSGHWPRPHREPVHSVATMERKACVARCKSNYEINVLSCKDMARGQRKECRAEDSQDRRECRAGC